MPLVFIMPGALRPFAGGLGEVHLEGDADTVADALALLFARFPAVRDRLVTERGEVRTHINIFVNGENIRHHRGLATPVPRGAELVILPAVSGGSVRAEAVHLAADVVRTPWGPCGSRPSSR
jgi:MoaD family protein